MNTPRELVPWTEATGSSESNSEAILPIWVIRKSFNDMHGLLAVEMQFTRF